MRSSDVVTTRNRRSIVLLYAVCLLQDMCFYGPAANRYATAHGVRTDAADARVPFALMLGGGACLAGAGCFFAGTRWAAMDATGV